MAEDLLKIAKKLCEVYIQRKTILNSEKKEVTVKDLIVTFPDKAVYVNTSEAELKDHIENNKLQYIVVMDDGKLVPDNHTAFLSSRAAKIETQKALGTSNADDSDDEGPKGKKKK